MRWQSAAIFGASGAIGRALTESMAGAGISVFAGAREARGPRGERITNFHWDLTDEKSAADAAQLMREEPPDLVIVASGVLTTEDGAKPEKSLKHVDAETMAEMFAINTIGPALVAKHMLPLLARDRSAIFAALSARVGSISDNRIGGWHSYRASKAALNMLIKNYAIEMQRTHKQTCIVGLHPGTVDSALSRPFQGNLPDGQLTAPGVAATNLLKVMSNLTPEQTGKVFDWKGEEVPA